MMQGLLLKEASKYLNDNTIFSVSDYSCRTAREAMGEGSGHLKKDMCIQMDHAAKYYIRTGRGHEITQEEAFKIIKRAEENGLMYQTPNLDGFGKTHAICNCCGCSCLSLRTVSMFKNVDMVRSNYVSHIDKEKCVACGECVETCPVNALKLGQKICEETPVKVKEKECPAHIAIQGYIKMASQGKYREALELIKHENPFPAVCGCICPRRCESASIRGDLDLPIAVEEIRCYV